jgi:hypothetical protein
MIAVVIDMNAKGMMMIINMKLDFGESILGGEEEEVVLGVTQIDLKDTLRAPRLGFQG